MSSECDIDNEKNCFTRLYEDYVERGIYWRLPELDMIIRGAPYTTLNESEAEATREAFWQSDNKDYVLTAHSLSSAVGSYGYFTGFGIGDAIIGFYAKSDVDFIVRYGNTEYEYKEERIQLKKGEFRLAVDGKDAYPCIMSVYHPIKVIGNVDDVSVIVAHLSMPLRKKMCCQMNSCAYVVANQFILTGGMVVFLPGSDTIKR